MGFICGALALIRKNTKEIQSKLENVGWIKAEYDGKYHIETKIGTFYCHKMTK